MTIGQEIGEALICRCRSMGARGEVGAVLDEVRGYSGGKIGKEPWGVRGRLLGGGQRGKGTAG